MPFIQVVGPVTKASAMLDTWGHLYPEPGSKHKGKMIIATGQYGHNVIISSDFPTLEDSPMRYELEHTIWDYFEFEHGLVYEVNCEIWFYKTSTDNMYNGRTIGKLIKLDTQTLE